MATKLSAENLSTQGATRKIASTNVHQVSLSVGESSTVYPITLYPSIVLVNHGQSYI